MYRELTNLGLLNKLVQTWNSDGFNIQLEHTPSAAISRKGNKVNIMCTSNSRDSITILAAKGGAGIVRENPALRSIDQLLGSPEKKHVGHTKTILT